MTSSRRKLKVKAEMNVVPYIDVMLVLLVIFMVTAPMLTQGIKIELPKVAGEPVMAEDPPSVITVSVASDGRYHWTHDSSVSMEPGEQATADLSRLTAAVDHLVRTNPNTEVFLRGDDAAAYGKVVAAMAALQQGGITEVALVTEVH